MACAPYARSGWAFVLGYGVSAMIRAFVPRGRLYICDADAQSVSLSTAFGAIGSSCSFAAPSAARDARERGRHPAGGVRGRGASGARFVTCVAMTT